MSDKVKPIPEGFHSVTPYLCVNDAAGALDFYKRAFGAEERMRMEAPGGKIGHAELKVGDSIVMLADEFPEMGFRSPHTPGGSPVLLHLYVEDVDAAVAQAVAAGAKLVREVKDQFYGDRSGGVEDPFGHMWYVSTHIEEVSYEEVKRRLASMGQECGEAATTAAASGSD